MSLISSRDLARNLCRHIVSKQSAFLAISFDLQYCACQDCAAPSKQWSAAFGCQEHGMNFKCPRLSCSEMLTDQTTECPKCHLTINPDDVALSHAVGVATATRL